ncbi:AAA family ATPase [Nocardioides sp.]|uniref:AAA family ATPase n=1 Tax=Nocardioides sp. TaxID=35761 RepID=UPI00273516FD|nr:AAA family ATPase [Nocardioides sp.]MDP3894297.1 AAA family ATPase [Nocardioides sp.]
MPLLDFDDPLPCSPHRIVVAGTSGSGKTTLAGRVAGVLVVPHIEIDALHHGPGWTPRETFLADVESFTGGPGWVTEWQYRAVRELLADRADLMVWLDLPRHVVMRQVVRRTIRRRMRREVLWNGNVEPGLRTFFINRDHIVRWSWRTHGLYPKRVRELVSQRPHLPVVRLRSHDQATRWVAGSLTASVR